jgi:hypothetical protein
LEHRNTEEGEITDQVEETQLLHLKSEDRESFFEIVYVSALECYSQEGDWLGERWVRAPFSGDFVWTKGK